MAASIVARTAIPTFDCVEGCAACCTVAPFTRAERDRASAKAPFLSWARLSIPGESYAPKIALDTMRCPFASATGCNIYEIRPLICRLYGAVDHSRMTCPKGRGPEQKLSHELAECLIQANEQEAS